MNSIETINHKLQFSISKFINYFIIISFLFPRGYAEFSLVYKNIFTCCVWISTIIIWIQFFFFFLKKEEILKKENIIIANYFIVTILITFILRGFSINGYQKLITYPSICLFTIYNLKKDPKDFLNIINNVFMVLFILNQLILRKFFLQQYHITFLGHVQMIAQLGALSIFSAIIYWMMFHEKKKRTILIVILALFTMITTDASSAKITCIILCMFAFLYKVKKYNFLKYSTNIYITIGIIASVTIVCISVINNIKFNNAIYFLDFSGRSFVWVDALSKIKNKIIFGYGIEGVLLNVFWNKWTNVDGFNYAHNQILQNFLDGGLVGAITFWLMIFTFCKNTKKILSEKYKVLINVIIIIFSAIMIFESTSLYCYMYICLSMIYALPNIIKDIKKGEKNINMGLISKMKLKFANIYYPYKIKKKSASYKGRIYVGGKSYVTDKTYLGNNVCFNGMSMSGQGTISIGDNFHSGPGCQIITSFHNYEGNEIPYDNTFINKDVTIGDNVWLGNNVIILGGVTIGEGAIIQAGSVVCNDIPECAIAGGHPAKAFKYRDKEHYYKLKDEKKFH